jgi:hypothetical protein
VEFTPLPFGFSSSSNYMSVDTERRDEIKCGFALPAYLELSRNLRKVGEWVTLGSEVNMKRGGRSRWVVYG